MDIKTKSKAGWINAVLIPVKQHLVCCGLLPLVANTVGGSTARVLQSSQAELALFIIVPPLVTYGVMAVEQKLKQRKHAECVCGHKILTTRNYFRQTALAYGFYAAAHLISHAVFPHEHHHEEAKHESLNSENTTNNFYIRSHNNCIVNENNYPYIA